ncbi:MAG TPA: hypothetical protein VLE91_02885 [Candidatus Saccharimonadales bacterium]|nr:hypothetical protein [Candidatus Saccharimonadales bacterium]
MTVNIYQKLTVAFLLFLFAFWSYLFFSGIQEGNLNFLYSFLFGLIPLLGGLVAVVNSRQWGTFGSAVGRAVFFIGLGLFLWGFGETIWSYYNFFQGVAAPYPSWADVGFAPSIFFYGLGAIFLSKATGAKYGLRNPFAKIFVVITPFVLLAFCYWLLVVVARQGVLITPDDPKLKSIFDIVYPVGDFIGLVISVIVSGLSFKYFGGKYLLDILSILAGLAVMTFADAVFSYTTTIGTYYNADWGDLMLTVGLFLITFGVLGFCSKLKAD